MDTLTIHVQIPVGDAHVADRLLAALRGLGGITVAASPPVPTLPRRAVPVASLLLLYPDRAYATLDGAELRLTRLEFLLLNYLATHPGRVFTRPQLLSRVWGYAHLVGQCTVDVHVRRLRAKLGDRGPTIHTVRGIGYRLERADRVQVVTDTADELIA